MPSASFRAAVLFPSPSTVLSLPFDRTTWARLPERDEGADQRGLAQLVQGGVDLDVLVRDGGREELVKSRPERPHQELAQRLVGAPQRLDRRGEVLVGVRGRQLPGDELGHQDAAVEDGFLVAGGSGDLERADGRSVGWVANRLGERSHHRRDRVPDRVTRADRMVGPV